MKKLLNAADHQMKREASKFQRGETQKQRKDLCEALELPNETLKRQYTAILEEFPYGLTGMRNITPMTIDGNAVEVAIFDAEEDFFSFGIFLPGQRYSRKDLEMDASGMISENTKGSIPAFDLAKDEPKFTSSNAQIAIAVMKGIRQTRTEKNKMSEETKRRIKDNPIMEKPLYIDSTTEEAFNEAGGCEYISKKELAALGQIFRSADGLQIFEDITDICIQNKEDMKKLFMLARAQKINLSEILKNKCLERYTMRTTAFAMD